MPTITISLNNKQFNLECSPENQQQVEELAGKLDNELKAITKANSHISFEFALVMLSLKLMAFKNSEVKLAGGDLLAAKEQERQEEINGISQELAAMIKKIDNIAKIGE